MADAKHRFAGIERAAILIALDNGGINRFRPEAKVRKEFAHWIETQPQEMLPPIDAWLASLTDEQLELVCCDTENGGHELLLSAPPFTDDLLNTYFDEAC
jgi:hypothetical protein